MAKIAVTVEAAKQRFDNARKAVKDADRLTAAVYDRFAADALMAAKGQPPERAATMYLRMAVAFEVLAERRYWPEMVHGLPRLSAKAAKKEAAEAVFRDGVVPTRA